MDLMLAQKQATGSSEPGVMHGRQTEGSAVAVVWW